VGGRGRGWSGWQGRGWGQGGEMTQALYAHMNNKTIKIKKKVLLELKIKMKKKIAKAMTFKLPFLGDQLV
jgi:hypothetical protein